MQFPNPIAVQLWTLRDLTARDFAATLGEVARAGYGAVEFAGYGGLDAWAMKSLLADTGLLAAGAHVGLELLEAEFERLAEYHLAIGCTNLVVPGPFAGFSYDATAWNDLGRRLGDLADRCEPMGLRLGYHNHAREFDMMDDRNAHELMFARAGEKLAAEVDTYWVQFAGLDPVSVINRMSGRMPLVHLKDMSRGPEPHDVEVGEGILDWDAILPACARAGAEWYVVELDQCRRPHLESVALALANLGRIAGRLA